MYLHVGNQLREVLCVDLLVIQTVIHVYTDLNQSINQSILI